MLRQTDRDEWRRQRIERALAELRHGPSGRELRTTRVEVRSEASGGKKILAGLTAPFGVLSEDLGGWRERLSPGCFRDCLARGTDVKFLMGHDPNRIMARRANGSLTVNETSAGLAFRAELPDTTDAEDLYKLVEEDLLDEMSFGFVADDDDWTDEQDPEDNRMIAVRTVRAATIFEISAVVFPAYSQTSVGISRSAAAGIEMRSRVRVPAISDQEWLERERARLALIRLECI